MTPRSTIEVAPSPNDVEFRKAVHSALRAATKEILVRTGELGSYQDELKEDALDALNRGVKVGVFVSGMADTAEVSELREHGADVYVGEWIPDHAVVVDGSTTILSPKETRGPSEPGSRRAIVFPGNAKKAEEERSRFFEVVSTSSTNTFIDFIENNKRRSMIIRLLDIVLLTSVPAYSQRKKAIFCVA